MYSQTSTGRLATLLLRPGQGDPNESSSKWMRGDGRMMLEFGRFGNSKSDYFVKLKGDDRSVLQSIEANQSGSAECKLAGRHPSGALPEDAIHRPWYRKGEATPRKVPTGQRRQTL
jgi:hypothetical protein